MTGGEGDNGGPDPTTGADGTTAWELLVRFHRRTTRAMDASLRDHAGRTLDEYDVLHQLAEAGRPVRMTELAARLLVANSSCNRIVGRLVTDGLVTRQPGEQDRRQVLVALSPEGRRLHRRLAVRHTRDIREAVDDVLDGPERDELARLLARLLDRADGHGGDGDGWAGEPAAPSD